MIVGTAGAAMPSRSADAIPIAGTSIGQAFVERTPRRLNNLDVTIDGVHHSGPALVLPLRTTDTVAGVLIVLRRGGARTFSEEQLDMMARSPTRRRSPGNWDPHSVGCVNSIFSLNATGSPAT
jgi:two-component system sensor histidine kinase DevS